MIFRKNQINKDSDEISFAVSFSSADVWRWFGQLFQLLTSGDEKNAPWAMELERRPDRMDSPRSLEVDARQARGGHRRMGCPTCRQASLYHPHHGRLPAVSSCQQKERKTQRVIILLIFFYTFICAFCCTACEGRAAVFVVSVTTTSKHPASFRFGGILHTTSED